MFVQTGKYWFLGLLLLKLFVGWSNGDVSNATTATGDNSTTIIATTVVSTAANQTTALPVSTTPSGPSTPSFYVRRDDGSSCIVFQALVQLDFQYPNVSGDMANIEFDGISLVYGPSAIAVTGSCDSSEQTITIPLSNNFTLSVGFGIKDEYTFVTSLNVTFLLDSRTFKGYNNASTLITAVKTFSPFELFGTPIGSSYQCNAGIDVTGFSSAHLVRVTFSPLRVQSFAKLNSTQFTGPARRCDADVSQVVPIVVAVVLGVLIIAVVVLYFVFHIRAKKYSEIK